MSRENPLTLEQARAAAGTQALQPDSKGRIRFAPNMTLTDRKRALKAAYRYYRRQETAWRFFLGNMVNDLRLPHGEKRGYCRKEFGEKTGLTVYGYAWAAGHWQDLTQEYDWTWGFYKEAARLPADLKQTLMDRHKVGCLDLDQCTEFCRKWKAENPLKNSAGITFDLKNDQKTNHSTLPLHSITNVEFAALLAGNRHAATLADALALREAASQRVQELQDETDEFADSEEE